MLRFTRIRVTTYFPQCSASTKEIKLAAAKLGFYAIGINGQIVSGYGRAPFQSIMSTELFMSCLESELQFHKPAERLLRACAVLVVVILLFGGITGLPATLPSFYLGLILFAVGGLLGIFKLPGTLVIKKEEQTCEGSIPLVTFGALTACIIAVFTIAFSAVVLLPTYLWSIGYINNIDAAMYRPVWWALGHSSQQINVAAHVAVWYAIAAIVFGARPLSEKVSRTVFFI